MNKYKNVFFLDDDESMIMLHSTLLQEEYQYAAISTFTNASEFIGWFLGNKEVQKQKSLLFLDINMPEKSGYEVLEELEEIPDILDELDVIFLSASDILVDFERATHYPNVIGYIEKPLNIENLKKILSGKK